MKLDNYLVLVVLVLSFSTLVSAEICGRDQSCFEQLGAGYFCDETNQTVDGNPQCSLNTITHICNQSAVCTSSFDCNGIGSPIYGNRGCGYSGLCVADPSVYGGKCVQDQDCFSNTQPGATSICSVGTCTYSSTGVITKCDDSSDCESDQFCYGTFGVCVNQRSEGGFCTNDAYCGDSLYCGDNICKGCEDIVDDPICTAQGAYCELNHSAHCQIGSHDYGGIVPICVSLKEEGESCWDDSCCATSNCENGVCVGAFSGGDPDSSSATFCKDLNYSLSTYYFDGVAISGSSEFDAVNLTNVNTLLNYSDLNSLRIPNIISDKFMFSRKEYGGAGYMVGLFYSNSTGDICYLHQKDTKLYTNCFESCLSADLATNETADGSVRLDNNFTLYPTFTCSNSDMAIESFQRNIPLYQYDFVAFTNFDSEAVDIDSAMAMGYLNTVYSQPIGVQYKQISSGLWVGGTYIMDPPSANPTWAFDGEPPYAVFHFDFNNPANGVRGWGHGSGSSWSGSGITDYLSNADYENIICCASNTDCINEMGDGFCCDPDLSTCYYCGLGDETQITITALTNIIAPDESVTLYGTLLDSAGNPIYNEEIEWTLLSGLGSINAQCTTDYEGTCQIIYTAPSEDTNVSVQAEFTGSSKYSGTKTAYSITVSDLSNSLFILVIDSASQQPLGNTKITDVNGILDPAIKYTIPFAGLVGWTGLNNTVEYYSVQVEREGYTSVLATVFPSPAPNIIPLTKTPESGAITEPLPNWGFNTTIPSNVGDVTSGFSELLRNFFAVPFLWVLMIILFFLGLAIVKGVIDYVTT
jgi:hypothetical protein